MFRFDICIHDFLYLPACNPDCGATGTCTGTDVCTCHPGWTGQTCDVAISDDFPYVNETCFVEDFSFGNGDFSKYNLHLHPGMSKSPNSNGALHMVDEMWKDSMIYSKMELNELMKTKRNVLVSVTVQMGDVNGAEGYSILFFDKFSLLTPDPLGEFTIYYVPCSPIYILIIF